MLKQIPLLSYYVMKEIVLLVEISDNGKGFDIEKAGKTCTGAGLINVRKRGREYLKGHLEMESIPEEHGLK